jgi:hypothetical protein
MLHGFFTLVGMAIGAAAGLFTFAFAREFVRQKLRFVDAIRHPIVPWVAAFIALMIASPIVAILPIVSGGTALLIGAGTGLGTASGVKALRRGD